MFITYHKKELKRNLACLLQYPVTLKDALCWEMGCLKACSFAPRTPEPTLVHAYPLDIFLQPALKAIAL